MRCLFDELSKRGTFESAASGARLESTALQVYSLMFECDNATGVDSPTPTDFDSLRGVDKACLLDSGVSIAGQLAPPSSEGLSIFQSPVLQWLLEPVVNGGLLPPPTEEVQELLDELPSS